MVSRSTAVRRIASSMSDCAEYNSLAGLYTPGEK